MTANRVARVAPLVGLAGRTAGEAVVASLISRRRGQRDGDKATHEFHARNAARYANQLGRSRGVLMKAGQVLSIVMPDSSIDTKHQGMYQAAFAKLQDNGPPMPADVAVEVIRTELGRPLDEMFAEFDLEPLASASIGQVHAATLSDGRRVVVKVQYPGVDDAIRADLANTELLATFLQLLFSMMRNLTKADVQAIAREISNRIGEEIDYRIEAANQQAFADAYRGHPFIRIPEVVPELSSRRVLVMEHADGVRYADAVRAGQALRDQWGEAIYRFILSSQYELGLVNTDPHPGNYLFREDGSVSFLDFGCVRRFTRDQVRTLARLLERTVAQDGAGLLRWGIESGWLDPADTPTEAEFLAWWSDAYRFLMPPQPFTVTSEYVTAMLHNRASFNSPYGQVPRKLTMPSEYTLGARIDIGMTAVLGGLRATAPWLAIRREWDRDEPPATVYGHLHTAFTAGRA
jgi:predicted unusual protein kinase regulating ubiquinone biosynthesis (AarF/ABC1/UbiB family)